MLFFIILIEISRETISYDSQVFNKFTWTESGFNCQNGFTKTTTIPFTNTFENIPKIIFFSTTFDYFFSTKNEVNIEILSVTLIDFSLKITCPNNKASSYKIQWYAIDDNRLEVITDLNQSPFTSKQYQIQNPNIKKGIISILSFSYTGTFNIDLSITELTYEHVIIGMSSAYQNLVSVSYQIILGTTEILTFLDQVSSTSAYTSQLYNQLSNSYFIIAQMKITTSLLNIRYSIALNPTANQISYTTATWNTNAYPTNKIQPYFLKYVQEQFFTAMECFTARISKLYDKTSNTKPPFYIQILELNKVSNSPGSEFIIIDESKLLLNINIYYKCPSNYKKVHSQLNKCNNCSGSNKIYNLNHYCHGSINSIYIYAQYSAQSNYKEILITITNNSIIILQKLRNKIITQQNILQVEFLDI
ncbi:unnamed protein product [Paramecium sonneborni]|uniref:H-type lectin domain-containing protein n=1 Tax=Paramecium sonneborni TaxID=65129 RepID=A0A8S1LMT9_9CILI|nr:unnamed protein product [Paramecium sonneborni]